VADKWRPALDRAVCTPRGSVMRSSNAQAVLAAAAAQGCLGDTPQTVLRAALEQAEIGAGREVIFLQAALLYMETMENMESMEHP
jgi:hypothetical protein